MKVLSKKERGDFLTQVCDFLNKKEGCHSTPYSSLRALKIVYKGFEYKLKIVIETKYIMLHNVVNGAYVEDQRVLFESPTRLDEIFTFLELVHRNTSLKTDIWYR